MSNTNPTARWSEARAQRWAAKEGWLVGSNYVPHYASNQIEMWQEGTFDAARIAEELGWARDLGMNTMRVFLHDLLWQQDAEGFTAHLDTFLDIAAANGIKPLLVLFDSVWNPDCALGQQPEPKAGVHNAGWVQGPGKKAILDAAEHPRLEAYVKGVVSAFAGDPRVLGWDVWNEPCNVNSASYAADEIPNKIAHVAPLLEKAFQWVREAKPSQPLTSGMWIGEWDDASRLSPVERIQIEQSDVISFHNYAPAEEFERRVTYLKSHNRPLLCTEYMARPLGSTFEAILPVACKHGVGMMNWGFVKGRTQTHLPWDSWQKPYDGEPPRWFHEILHEDGRPYDKAETDLIRSFTARPQGKKLTPQKPQP